MKKTINFSEVNPISKSENRSIKNQIYSIIKKKDFILGNSLSLFEKKFSELSKIKHSIGCASGTDALILALMSLGLKEKDEIIVPGLTYISTGLSVLLRNHKLVIADIDSNTGLISIEDVKKKINKNTKVIIPVNLYGQKINLKKLKSVVGSKIKIIEDSAQSHFAYSCYDCSQKEGLKCCKKEHNEKFADISCYSFYPSKNLGAYGDGGLVATNNIRLYKKLLTLRNLGAIKKNKHQLLGMNSRLDTIQAVVLKNKLKSILRLNDDRRKIANFYDKHLKRIKQIKLTKTKPGSSRHLYVIRTRKRDSLLKYLIRRDILCQIHYPYCLNKIGPFVKKIKKKVTLKNSENWSRQCLSLPLYPKLMKSDAKRIIKEINNFFK